MTSLARFLLAVALLSITVGIVSLARPLSPLLPAWLQLFAHAAALVAGAALLSAVWTDATGVAFWLDRRCRGNPRLGVTSWCSGSLSLHLLVFEVGVHYPRRWSRWFVPAVSAAAGLLGAAFLIGLLAAAFLLGGLL